MTISEMISKYNISAVVQNGQEMINIRPSRKPTAAELNAIKAAKPEILQYLADKAAERQAILAARRAEQEAIDKVCLEKMEAEVTELRKQIPSGHTEVKVTQTGDMDGYPVLEYEADGVKLNWQDVNKVGIACAIRPGAMGAFETVYVFSISRERLEEIRTEQKKTADEKETQEIAEKAELQAKFDEAKATGKNVKIRTYMAECNDPKESCSTDVVTEYAMPDGRVKKERMHTW